MWLENISSWIFFLLSLLSHWKITKTHSVHFSMRNFKSIEEWTQICTPWHVRVFHSNKLEFFLWSTISISTLLAHWKILTGVFSKLQNKLKSYWKLWNHFWLTELQILDSILSVANYQGIWLRLKWFARKTIILPRMIPLSSILCMFLVKFGRKTILPLLYLSVCRNSYTVFSRNSS